MRIAIKGLAHAIKTAQLYAISDKLLLEVAEQLCKIGEPIIRQIHGHHADYIDTVPTETGYKIVAEGTDVLFIEFGAGDAAGRDNASYDAVPVVARPGSWSEAHGGEYATTKAATGQGQWHFGGRVYTELPPSPSMYYAYEYMIRSLPQIVKDVFGTT